MNNRSITPEMARAELERRSSAKAEIDRRNFDNTLAGSISKIPGYAMGAALQLPGKLFDLAKEVPGAAKKIVREPMNSLQDILGGIAHGSQNLASTLGEAGQGIASTLTGGYAPRVDIREEMGLGKKNPVNLGKMIESSNPNPLISALGQYGLGGAAGGARILPMTVANAANAATQAAPGERLKSGIEGGVSAAIPVSAIRGANALRPSKMFAGKLSADELRANLDAAQGTTTGLGDVVGSPALKRLYENVLPRIAFSGADKAMHETANKLIKQGEGHLEKLNENIPAGDKTKILQDAIKDASIEAAEQNRANFKKVDKIADDMGLTVSRKNFSQKANEILNEIEKSSELKRELSPEILADLKSYAIQSNGNSLRLSNIFKGKLNDKASEFYVNGKKYEYGLMKGLKDALGSDIDSAINSSKNKALREAYDFAQKEHGSKYKQFEDPDITKFTREGGDNDLILSHFLKTGANDRSNLLAKVSTKLPTELQNLPASMYLSKAIEEGKLNPIKLNTLYKKLGQKQKETLIPDAEMRKSLDKYTKSIGMNTEAFQTMFNPKTGQRALDSMLPAMQAIGGSHLLGGVPGAAAGIIVPALAGKAATKLLTNPTIRDALVKSIIKAKSKGTS